MLEYLIVGSGRCGSGSLSDFLNKNGIKCGHESIFNPFELDDFVMDQATFKSRLKSTGVRAESSWLAVPYLSTPLIPSKTKIVHLLRNPVHTIKSFMDIGLFKPENSGSEYILYMKKHKPEIFNPAYSEAGTIMRYYHAWNKHIFDHIEVYPKRIVHHIEDSTDMLCSFFGLSPAKLSVTNRKKHLKKKTYRESDILVMLKKDPFYDEFQIFSEKCGYKI